jgi:hypothetical protein
MYIFASIDTYAAAERKKVHPAIGFECIVASGTRER